MKRVILLSLIVLSTSATAFAQAPLPPPSSPPATFLQSPDVQTGTEESAYPAGDPQASVKPSPLDPYFFPVDGRVELKPTFQLRGRIEAEATAASQSAESIATLGDLQNGFGFRRFRLGAQGNINDSSSWVGEVELAGGNVRLRDVFVGLDALPGVRQVRIGHFREPYSLDGMTSSNFMTFLERAPINVISPARNWGVCGYWWPTDERVLFSLGAFRDGTGNDGQSVGDGDNWAYTARLTGLPIYEPDGENFQLLHLGGAFSQRVPPNGIINFTPRTGSNLLSVDDNPGSPFLPRLNIPANDYQLYNLQAGHVHGPFSIQSEWSAAAVQEPDGTHLFVHGMYLAGSYFVTGEHRSYNRTRGSFDLVDVLDPITRTRHGHGAVELTSRFSWFDFNSPNMPPDANGNPAGTLLYEMTFGVNWYLNSYTRMMFNYTAGMPDKVGFGPTVAHIFGIRTALFW